LCLDIINLITHLETRNHVITIFFPRIPSRLLSLFTWINSALLIGSLFIDL